MKTFKREYLDRFTIAGFSYYDGCVAFKKIKVGTKLQFVLEPKNHYDENAVAVYYKKYKLGYIPRDRNQTISKLLKCGVNVFEVRVQRISSAAHTEEQIEVILYVINTKC